MQLALSGQTIDARKAAEIGLVGQLASAAQLEATAIRLADQCSAIPPDAIAATKRLLAPGTPWSDEAASDAFANCLQTEPARNSIARFR